jgi:hypothetical protein
MEHKRYFSTFHTYVFSRFNYNKIMQPRHRIQTLQHTRWGQSFASLRVKLQTRQFRAVQTSSAISCEPSPKTFIYICFV